MTNRGHKSRLWQMHYDPPVRFDASTKKTPRPALCTMCRTKLYEILGAVFVCLFVFWVVVNV